MTGVINGSKCFVAGTLVLTEDGEKPIEEIEVGDYVYASDPETGESDYKEVLNVFIRQSNIIIHVFVNGEEIETTPTHPFWVEDEWVTADKLKAGDILTLADGTTCAIDRVYAEFTNKAITVYNFEVADFHSYYVTDTGVLVHNANPEDYVIPIEPYNRKKHYGNTPTKSDRDIIGGSPDHDPPLVVRYYEGDPIKGEKPGYLMTADERKASAKDRSRMKPSTKAKQNSQGGTLSNYSKKMKKKYGLS